MLKKTGIILCSLLFASSISYAENSGVYIGGHIGAAGVENSDTETFASYKIGGTTSGVPGSRPFGNQREIGLAGGISVGYDFKERYNTPVRVEVNYTARSDAKSEKDRQLSPGSVGYTKLAQKTNLQTLMLNLWADIPTNTALTPYVGGGIGVAFIDYEMDATNYDAGTFNGKFYSGSAKKTNFAWSLGGGVAYDVTPQFAVDLGYRYIDAGKITNETNTVLHGVIVGGTIYPANHVKAETKVKSNELFLEGRYKF